MIKQKLYLLVVVRYNLQQIDDWNELAETFEGIKNLTRFTF